ncbi:MAG: hypothetical protein CVU78_01215 [Elusimicrobia bacterium HGW-Elusimicrobia-2]|nr:MAG: hypothetical protein CVU78_01215 [Elusimicrobia bacterium HGW-Elusimicrobia-2]
MKLLLINPPSENELLGNNPQIIESERGFNPPLGLLYIAAYLRENSSHDIAVIDAPAEQLSYSLLEKRIAAFAPDVVGITAMTFTMRDVLKTAGIVKKLNNDTKCVLGGPHVFIYPDETINLPQIDFLILGEGEIVFKEFLDTIENGGDLSKVPSLVYKNNSGETVKTPIAPMIEDLDALPHPARDLTPFERYSSLIFSRTPVTTVFTSRGCPYGCKFCLRPHLGKKFRCRSAENVIGELKECVQMGIRDFLIYDDTFTVIKKRVSDICELIIKEKMDIRWDCRARVDTVNEELLVKMKEAGCIGVHYGIESGSLKVLKNINKGIAPEQARDVCALTRKIGLKVLTYFMIGLPGETMADMEETFSMMRRVKADYAHLTIFTPFPGTELYRSGLESGIIKKDHWKKFAENPDEVFVPPHWGENFTREQLQELLVRAYQGFYLRPGNIARILFNIRTPGEFFRKARAGLKVMFMKKQ